LTPVPVARNTRRWPPVSLTTTARTAPLASLIFLAMSASLSVAVTLMVSALPWGVNTGPESHCPVSMVSVPDPTGTLPLSTADRATCPCAIWLTVTLYCPSSAVLLALPRTASALLLTDMA
jgi:hypothetical protein